jgi:glycosyltransferase involved in cell wall biosynthesis
MLASPANPTVLIIMPLAEQRGGAELALLQLIRRETSVHWHVVFLIDGPMVQQTQALGVGATVIPAGRVRQPLMVFRTVRAIARLAREIKASAMLGWMAKAHLYGGLAAKIAGIPAVWFQHGLPSTDSWIDSLVNRIPAAGSLACSEFVADAQRRVTPNLPVRVVHPATDLENFDPPRLPTPAECREQLKLPAVGPIIGIFGRLQTWKGMHVLIDAFPAILAKYPCATAVIVGGVWELEAAYETKLVLRAQALGVTQRVVFAGHQTNVSQWMQACDVIVHASDREPFGMVVVEAMALGKPVVAGAAGGPREVITDGVDGFLVGFGDTAGLSESILKYLDNQTMAHRMGEAARSRAQYFSVERFAGSVSEAMKQWINSASAAQEHAGSKHAGSKHARPVNGN